jgi:hypothetical protein
LIEPSGVLAYRVSNPRIRGYDTCSFLLSCGSKMSTSGFGMPAENPAGHDNDKRVAEFLHDLRYYSVRLTLLLSLLCLFLFRSILRSHRVSTYIISLLYFGFLAESSRTYKVAVPQTIRGLTSYANDSITRVERLPYAKPLLPLHSSEDDTGVS